MACTSMQTHEQKVQSLQHSILFLQNQHTVTLSSLYKEIEKLQQRCSELLHELALGGIRQNSVDTGPAIKSALEDEIRTMRESNINLTTTLKKKEKRIHLLEGQLKSKEQKYHDDLKNIQRRTAELENELDYKSNAIAHLTSKIQKKKMKFGSDDVDINIPDPSNRFNSHEKASDNNLIKLSPIPPSSESPTRRRNYNLRRRNTSPSANKAGIIQERSSHQLIASDCVLQNSPPKTNKTRSSNRYKQSVADPPGPGAGHSRLGRDRNELKFASPSKPKPIGYEDFIRVSHSQEIMQKTAIEPLPPITTRSGRQLHESIQTPSRTLRSNKATANSRGEIETVIMDANLSSPDRTLRKIKNSSK